MFPNGLTSTVITFQGPGGFATPDDLEALEACQAGVRGRRRAVVGHLAGHVARALQPTMHHLRRAADARAFWRRWEALMGTP